MVAWMHFLTDFADQAVVLPALVAVAVLFAVLTWWRGFFGWIIAAGGTLGIMLLLKVLGLFVFKDFEARPFSASGHTACAGLLYGGVGVMLSYYKLPSSMRGLIPLLFVVVIGASRLAVHAHSMPEVLVGGAVGYVGAALFSNLSGPPPQIAAALAAMVSVGAMFAFHGYHLPVEQVIRHTVLGN